MGGKSKEISHRRKYILQSLAQRPDGWAGYDFLTEALKNAGYDVVARTVRNDCNYLTKLGYVERIKSGAVITREGREHLECRELPDEELKEKHLKQLAVLKRLYAGECSTFKKGLLPGEIAQAETIGSESVVKDILQALAAEGLVTQNGECWCLGTGLPAPVSVQGKNARLLYEYLDMVSAMVPLPPDLAMLRSKLVPLMVMPRRRQWRENLVKVVDRIVVHGRGNGDPGETTRVIALVEEAVFGSRAVLVNYRGRALRLHPLGVAYHWEKRHWYVIALTNGRGTIMDYRADRITSVELSDETFAKPDGFDLDQHLAGRWGVSNDVETSVTVRFKNTAWHITALEKLQGDVSRRQTYHLDCRLEKQADGSILLKDRVTGLSEFTAWIRSYGDAAEVLEPECLRQRMALTARKMLDKYGIEGEMG